MAHGLLMYMYDIHIAAVRTRCYSACLGVQQFRSVLGVPGVPPCFPHTPYRPWIAIIIIDSVHTAV